jgi:hypothetical protein
LGATGERTDLNRGESHAPIRSRSTVSDGGGDTTLDGQPSGDIANVSQPPPPESATAIGRRHPPRMTLSSGMTPEEVRLDLPAAGEFLVVCRSLARTDP